MHLRIVRGALTDDAPPQAEAAEHWQQTPLVRPGDRLEPWPLEPDEDVWKFATTCSAAGVPFALAARLVVERTLAVETVAAATGDSTTDLAARLTVSATVATVALPLSPALAAYLRVLRSRQLPNGGLPANIRLPVRLRDRLGDRAPSALLDPSVVEEALVWERAATSRALTMTEWAATTAVHVRG